jgi:hypothetical protein
VQGRGLRQPPAAMAGAQLSIRLTSPNFNAIAAATGLFLFV